MKPFHFHIEYILCAAIHFTDGKEHGGQPINVTHGVVLCAHRHHNVFAQTGLSVMQRKMEGWEQVEQGFLTNRNRFVNREEAAQIAKEAGQLKPGVVSVQRLFSEDLY